MAESARRRRAPTELDLTTTERQPDGVLPGRHRLRIGSKLLDLKVESPDAGVTIMAAGVVVTAIFSATVLGLKSAVSAPVVLGVLLVDALILLATWAYARWGVRRTEKRRRVASPSSTRVLRPGMGQRQSPAATPKRRRRRRKLPASEAAIDSKSEKDPGGAV